MTNASSDYRLRAIASELRAKKVTDADAKLEWEELARQWHLMANLAASDDGDILQTDVA
jgi:hypothetical protein